jgi:hypothetical protein
MANDTKWLNTRLPTALKERYDNALKLAKEQSNQHVFSPQIIVPAIEAFCESAEAGDSKNFLNGKYAKQN